ncbi:MAG: sulfatase-like hydrolase/transferase, partial [Erysipelotrichaceae bacterium]|nr:sulfatase-like hydrolase/transferase [Erysipelotrichaceae bacterium]
LLTSNSLRLLRNEHPFNYLKMDKNKNNVVQYLNGLNYTTVAMHCRNGVNYSRHNGYPALGFDKSIIPYNNKNVGFYTYNKYGNRDFLDKDNYADMIRAYNELGDGPRFMYLLTYQNHGWWEQNDSSLDTVHSSADLGANWLTRSMDEYLTSVQMSADAFKELTEYYKTVDRPVIICMVGDHAPAFIKELPDNGHSELENMFNQRAVPYVIWGNFPLETDLDTEYVSLFDLMPMISDICDMPLTTYQKTILDLHQDVPVVLSDGYYYTKEGKIEKIDKSSKYYDEIMKYYYMEYNSLGNQKDYRKELFELKH